MFETHKHRLFMLLFYFRVIVAVLFGALVIFVLVDVFVYTKQYYNLVSALGIFVYVFLFFIFSYCPAKVSIVLSKHLTVKQMSTTTYNLNSHCPPVRLNIRPTDSLVQSLADSLSICLPLAARLSSICSNFLTTRNKTFP